MSKSEDLSDAALLELREQLNLLERQAIDLFMAGPMVIKGLSAERIKALGDVSRYALQKILMESFEVNYELQKRGVK